MDANQWARVREVFDRIVDDPASEREARLNALCPDQPQIRDEVRSLLAAHDRATTFIEQPAFEAAADLLADSLEDTAVGPYLIRHEIGRGGMGVVYLADDTRLSRRVALKALSPDVARDPRRRERLRQEARAAAALTHPNIATLYALEEIHHELYLAFEYVAGPTLRAVIERGPQPAIEVARIGVQLARALVAAHGQGIVHRDLKPENVVRTGAGDVKILDFGIARIESAPAGALSDAGAAIGTPGYMAPEQIRGEAVDFRADLFALGVLLYELAAGTNPFAAATTTGRIARILETDPAPLSTVSHESAPALDRLVAICLKKDPSARYPSTHDLLADLERIYAELAARRTRTGDLGATAGRARSPWWEVHQLAAAIAYVGMMVPVWDARSWLPKPWGTVFLLTTLWCAASVATIRLHLWFTSRFYPEQAAGTRRNLLMWTRVCDASWALALLAATAYVGTEHEAMAVLFVTAAVGMLIASFVIEPTTTRATFGE